ncbi:MAG: pilus assembly protein TadG-related protein, partial [Anaerolineae bacterium]|nr:pilus assembly protein TadG-related protein [Anaerolineae bacterium]
AIDGGRVFSDRRHAQNAADTAALAAALAKIRAEPPSSADDAAKAAARDRALSNGYANDSDSVVEVHICNEPGVVCQGMPVGADASEYIQVKITSTVQTTFARIIGRSSMTHTLEAIAWAKLGEPGPLFEGMALAAMSPDDPDAMKGHGNVFLDINNSGVFVNSIAEGCPGGAMGVVGNGNYEVDTAFAIVGDLCQNGNPVLDENLVQQASQIPYPPEINIPAPSITCSVPSVLTGNTYSPGIHNSLNVPNGTYTFAAGNHCFNGGVTINGGTDIIANDVNFLLSSGEFRSNANGSFTCTNTLVHINGGTGMHFNGAASINCTGVTFYVSTGDLTWNGGVSNNLTAPTSGPYAHLLIYLPSTNSSPLSIIGNSDNSLTGSIIAVASLISIEGNTGTFALSSQITGHTVDIGGNGTIQINYDPAQQYAITSPTTIQLTK